MNQIENVVPMADYKLQVFFVNGSNITLNLESRLNTVRFGMLANREFFQQVSTDGSYIRWGNKIEISINEIFQMPWS